MHFLVEDEGGPKTKYKAYNPSALDNATDKIVSLFSPRKALERAQYREASHFFRYRCAQSNSVRQNSSPTRISGDTLIGNRERLQLEWNALETIENSGLAWSIKDKVIQYVCGTLRFQARTGDKAINSEYEGWAKTALGKSVDLGLNRTFRQICGTGIGGQFSRGDFGINFVREGPMLYLQGIEGDRIGNPYDYKVSENFVGGIELGPGNRKDAYHIYKRMRATGQYKYDMRIVARTPTLGLPNFLFSANPNSFDDVRGRSTLARAIDKIAYCEDMARYELEAMVWASSQSGVFYTNNGQLPESLGFKDQQVTKDQNGNNVFSFRVRPGEVTALGIAEKVEMFNSERPSPNVIAMYKSVIREIALKLRLLVWLCLRHERVERPRG
jgi:hypothetical protein